jgi:hypothetical protein
MPFSDTTTFDAEFLRSWRRRTGSVAELGQTPKVDQTPEQRVALDELVTGITAAAEAGERDGERLKTAALGSTLRAIEKD